MNDVLTAFLILFGTYLLYQIGRVVSAILHVKINYCPYCLAVITTWVIGLVLRWDLVIPSMLIGVTIFDLATRIKAKLTAKGKPYADYARQAITTFLVFTALYILQIIGKL